MVRMGAFLPFPVTAAPSRGTTLTCKDGFCKLGATLGQVEGTTHGGGEEEELMALLSRLTPPPHSSSPKAKGRSSAGHGVHKHNKTTKTLDKYGGKGEAVWHTGAISG